MVVVTLLKKLLKSFKSYNQKKESEIEHFNEVFKGKLFQSVPPAWDEVENIFSKKIKRKTGANNVYEYIGKLTKNKKSVKILGLGSGACGNELNGIAPILLKNKTKMELFCLDINKSALNQASKEAKKRNINFHAILQDINKVSLPANKFDIIIAYAALHHFLKLDHISQEINKSLKKDGIFVTVDIPTRKGYLMWPETCKIINNIWKTLPDKFKIDHTKNDKPCFAPFYENIDYSLNSFECINSEAILPSLRTHLKELIFIPAFSISRRFFDTKFGPNYDLRRTLDRSIFNYITLLDDYYLSKNILKPETFFGVYSKKC